nr:unnamed protein product [Callosobruchus chinensis]
MSAKQRSLIDSAKENSSMQLRPRSVSNSEVKYLILMVKTLRSNCGTRLGKSVIEPL